MRILATGGAGYIGSHVVLRLLEAGHEVVVVDDFSRGSRESLDRVQELAGASLSLHEGDVADPAVVEPALEGVEVVIHFAAFKDIGESMRDPQLYLRNNLGGLGGLISAMEGRGVRRIVYSSSAAVYGTQTEQPMHEGLPLLPDSPYGLSKAQGEEWLSWMVRVRGWSVTSLRYFNPVGAHPSGLLGEPLRGASNLFPRILEAYADPTRPLTVFGTDYATPDGTCQRDYIHVLDLARAHLLALAAPASSGHRVYNVGTGRPRSVLEVLAAFERVTGSPVPARMGPRRPGDVPVCSADGRRLREELGFVADFDLDAMVEDTLRRLSA